ncbi:MAG: squalene/phytoene synthase family protein [Bacteroidales bacterium]|jgi:phytoene/squalene synthetase
MSSLREELLEIFNSMDFQQLKEHPNILIAAGFWEKDRLCAAKICYKFMRTIDDLIDDHKAANRMIAPPERKEFTSIVNDWLKMILTSDKCNPLQKELADTMEQFRIPLWPLETFAKSMIYDINNDGFPTLETFLDYSQGASVAPASVFVHLNCLTKRNGVYQAPQFDVRETAIPCAVFSYIVHIIRDFQKDQKNNLNYFADDLIARNNLTRKDLSEFANGRALNRDFRNLISVYYTLADEYRIRTGEMIKKRAPLLEVRYRFSLELIFDLYMMIFERINISDGKFTAEEMNPTAEETRNRVYEKIMSFNPAIFSY